MQYTTLPNTDISVSKLCLGSMTWGEQNSETEAHEQLDYAVERGINFVDTAEMYPVPPNTQTQGLTETYIGNWLAKGNRDKVVLASKITGPAVWIPWVRDGNSRFIEKNITEALENSLRRLQTDSIDLYQLHWPDRPTNYFGELGYFHKDDPDTTPIHETLAALQKQIEAGKIRAIGLSNETPWGMMKFVEAARYHNLPRVASIQNPYNLLNRVFEIGHAEISHLEDIGLLAYSPLAFGVLSGKYLDGQKPAGSRMARFSHFDRYTKPEAEEAVQSYKQIADEYDISLTQMSLAYVNTRSFLCSNIIGATSLQQLEENIDSLDIKLDKKLLQKIESIHQHNSNPCP
ncbi:MAG: NADP(H)-dependent aldo-keto reductase [Gammaproteobacteria bacterium]|nr:NADP(H)-dependent aldo-keto reductase [Gammaproteobacteria bacterium]